MTRQIITNSKQMKAIVSTKYGGPEVLQLQEVSKPSPKADEVLIKVHAASVTAADSMIRRAEPFYGRLVLGLSKPKNPIPGTGFAGVIEAVGSEVVKFSVGEKVFGETGMNFGAHAEYVCVSETGLIKPLPSQMSFEEAASICDGPLTSLNFLKNLGNIQAGDKVLINGASGSLGTSAIQLAKHFGAEVTGICSSGNIALVKALGADKVINYTKSDFTKNGETYDIIYDTVGKLSFSTSKASLKKNGAYISPVLGIGLLFQMLWTSVVGTKKAKFSATGVLPVPELLVLLDELTEIIELGKIETVIDKRYGLEQIVEAHRYVDTGHKKGNLVIKM